jgi:ribosomal protein S21
LVTLYVRPEDSYDQSIQKFKQLVKSNGDLTLVKERRYFLSARECRELKRAKNLARKQKQAMRNQKIWARKNKGKK